MRIIKTITIITVIQIFSMVYGATYYVATTGNDSNDGLSESSAWETIKYATKHISAGDTVYVKAGTYSGENLKIPSGTSNSSTLFEGYKNIPGDVANIDWWDYETNRDLDSTKMPLLDGGNRATAGTAIQTSSYTILRNFQVTNYTDGVNTWSGSYYTIENIIVTNIGDINDSYSGTAIGIYYSSNGHNTIRNCVVLNSAAEALMVYKNDNNLLENVKVYCDDAQNTYANTDYYFEIESNDNTIRNCYIERVGNLEHVGHGFCIKGDGYSYSGNLFENCVARNLEGGGFVVRHHGVTNNVFKNCTAYGAVGFLVRDGANHNKFYNCKAVDCNSAVRFMYTGEDDSNPDYAGNNNDFYNCIFQNSKYVIDFNSYNGYYNKSADNNRFINTVIDGGTNLFQCSRTNNNNEIINSIITNVTNLKSGSYNLDAVYTNCDFWDNGFSTPTGSDLLEADPLFVDTSNGDYNLSATSPCIDAGTSDTTGLSLPEYDAAGNVRIVDGNDDNVAVIDMGIYEYNSSPVSIVESSIAMRDKFILHNNYPNPFNPSTTIRFFVPYNETVTITVYNILGQKVAELLNDKLAAGDHKVVFNAFNLPSGIYLYKVSAGNFKLFKRMLLVK